MTKEREQDPNQIVWTKCEKCGDTWTTRAVLRPGKCPVCGGKPKSQKAVF